MQRTLAVVQQVPRALCNDLLSCAKEYTPAVKNISSLAEKDTALAGDTFEAIYQKIDKKTQMKFYDIKNLNKPDHCELVYILLIYVKFVVSFISGEVQTAPDPLFQFPVLFLFEIGIIG